MWWLLSAEVALAQVALDGMPAFEALPEEQRLWLRQLASQSIACRPAVYAFGLEPTVDLYRDATFTRLAESMVSPPHAVGEPSDYGGHLEPVGVLDARGPAWLVDVGGHQGWVRRGALRVDSLVVASVDGTYRRDLVPNCVAGGSRCETKLTSDATGPMLLLRYVASYRGDAERWFALRVDVERGVFTEWVEPPPAPTGAALSAVLAPDAITRLSESLGFGRTGFVQAADGSRIERAMFFAPLSAERDAVVSGDLVLINASMFAGTSPARP